MNCFSEYDKSLSSRCRFYSAAFFELFSFFIHSYYRKILEVEKNTEDM